MNPSDFVTRLHRRWRVIKSLELVSALLLVSVGLFQSLKFVLTSEVLFVFTITLCAAGLVIIAVVVVRIDATMITRHIDRAIPQAQDSASLLLTPSSDMSDVRKIQRSRVERVLSSHPFGGVLPNGPIARASFFAGASLIILISVTFMPIANPLRPEVGGALESLTPAVSGTGVQPSIVDVALTVQPPRYTSLPTVQESRWGTRVPESSTVQWQITTSGHVDSLLLNFGSGEVVSASRNGDRWVARVILTSSVLYHVEMQTGDEVAVSAFHKLTVVPDAPPSVSITSLATRTVLPIEGPWNLTVEAVASDDYGVRGADIVATVTSGSGEAVVFREEVIPLEGSASGALTTNMAAGLDLEQLGMTLGDELYFYVRVVDNRQPESNKTRTETYFVTIPDTAQVLEVSSMGIAVNPLAESLLSQRQIIIETERLIASRQSLDVTEFNNHSNVVGMNQKTVRLRYGQFLGEEDEPGGDITEEHLHDTEVGATTYTPDVRIRLQGALAQMWEAELQLRLNKPESAIPFEYRALELLIELQELRRREYVKRVGFEPTPLREDARLTGELDEINDVSVQEDFADIRSGPIVTALSALRSLSAGEITPNAIGALRGGNVVLAGEAFDSDRDLIPALENMRRLIAALETDTICVSCIAPIERGLWSVLPAGEARPWADNDRPTGVGRAYLEKLEQLN